MNNFYRVIWNELTRTWIAVSEIARTRGKRASKSLLIASACAALPAPTFAQTAPPPNTLPTGGKVVAGAANITQSGATMNIKQSSQRGVIDWNTFNLGSAAAVNFIQPSRSSATLNRVLDPNPSQIFGRINANGQVFLTNSSGIYFGRSATASVGALTATTHSIGNDDFTAGNLRFTRNGATGNVVNEGNLTADLNGYIALLAPEVRNHGVIVAQMGTVALAAGEVFELPFDNGRLANIRVEPATIAALVENGSAVQAPGGFIILSAQAANRLQGGVVQNSGALEATGLVENGGTIRLMASDRITHSGSINIDAAPGRVGAGGAATLIADVSNPDSVTEVSGSISARGGDFGGNGGFVETSGGRVRIGDGTRVDTRAPQGETGQWLLDPNNFTISAAGGNMRGATIATNLQTSNVTISTATQGTAGGNGDIFISDNIVTTTGLGATRTLTLQAERDIVMQEGRTIDATRGGNTQRLNIVFNSASAGGASGAILIGGASSTSIKSNGGTISLVGGAGGTGYALGGSNAYTFGGEAHQDGISLSNATLNSGGGTVTLRGKGYAGNASLHAGGIWTKDSSINTGGGSLVMDMQSQQNGGATTGGARYGVFLDATAINAAGGSIQISASGPSVGTENFNTVSNSSIASGAGSITLSADSVSLGGGSVLSGAGALTIQPVTAGTTIGTGSGMGTLSLSATELGYFQNGFSGITIGNATAGNLTVGGALSFNDPVTLRSSGNITLNSGASLTASAGDSITLAAGGNFINNSGSSVLNVSGGGRWLVYSTTPGNNTFGGLLSNNLALWGQTYGGSVTATGNRYLFSMQPVLTVTASNRTKTYGDTPYLNASYTISGLINAATYGGVFSQETYAGMPTLSSSGAAATASVTGSPYSITVTAGTFASPVGYGTTEYVAGRLTITKKQLSVWPNQQSIVYGQPFPVFTQRFIGFVNGENFVTAGITGKAQYNCFSTCVNVGNYPIDVGIGTLRAPNYDFVFPSLGTLTIVKAPLTITPNNQVRLYGQDNPTFTQTITGFIPGEEWIAINLNAIGIGVGSSVANISSSTGTYQILANSSTIANSAYLRNYEIKGGVGTLTINKTHLTVTADNKSREYGAPNPTFTETITGFVNGENATTAGITGSAFGSSSATLASSAGNYPINGSTGTLAAANYDFTAADGTLTVLPVPPVPPAPPSPTSLPTEVSNPLSITANTATASTGSNDSGGTHSLYQAVNSLMAKLDALFSQRNLPGAPPTSLAGKIDWLESLVKDSLSGPMNTIADDNPFAYGNAVNFPRASSGAMDTQFQNPIGNSANSANSAIDTNESIRPLIGPGSNTSSGPATTEAFSQLPLPVLINKTMRRIDDLLLMLGVNATNTPLGLEEKVDLIIKTMGENRNNSAPSGEAASSGTENININNVRSYREQVFDPTYNSVGGN